MDARALSFSSLITHRIHSASTGSAACRRATTVGAARPYTRAKAPLVVGGRAGRAAPLPPRPGAAAPAMTPGVGGPRN